MPHRKLRTRASAQRAWCWVLCIELGEGLADGSMEFRRWDLWRLVGGLAAEHHRRACGDVAAIERGDALRELCRLPRADQAGGCWMHGTHCRARG